MNKLHTTKDRHRLLIQVKTPKGKLISERLYCDRRVGITWPSMHNPGYFGIIGLYDEPAPRRMRLLFEFESPDRSVLIRKLTAMSQHLGANWILADLSDEFLPFERSFWNYCRAKNVRGLDLIDVADISGFKRARATIDDLTRQRRIRMSKQSIMYGQGLVMSQDNVGPVAGARPEQIWYAVGALGHIVCSYDHWPWTSPKKKKRRILGDRAGYG